MAQTPKDFNPKTVTIDNQIWMDENLSINDGGEGITYNTDSGQYYYTWDAAIRIAKSIPGWHLPSAEEWNTAAEACWAKVMSKRCGMADPRMRDYIGAEKLYDSLKVLPVGGYYKDSFHKVGFAAYFWSATEAGSYAAYYRGFTTSGTMYQYTDLQSNGLSVRLIKDKGVVSEPTTEAINVMDPATLKQLHDSALADMAKEAENLDYEAAHANADKILCGLLRKLGFGDVVDAYDKVPQW